MTLDELREHWNQFGKTDPLWAILVRDKRKGGQWDLDEFFSTGRGEVAGFMAQLDQFGLPAMRKTALDFGCGVGRLTQALCSWFERCCGVDIAPSMIELARSYNAFGDRCEYRLNPADDLSQFSDRSFDLIYSKIVLQHMHPRYSAAYIREFVRLLRPQGMLAFQLPASPNFTPHGRGTVGTGRLPNTAYRAVITGYPSQTKAGRDSPLYVSVTIRNNGTSTWPCLADSKGRYAVTLGNHWRHLDGSVSAWDDARAFLPSDVEPGQEIELTIPVHAPRQPGTYLLQLDMVHENVTWFAQKGSPVANITVEVSEGLFEPRMEMYGIEKAEVMDLLTASGARVVDVVADDAAGPDWTSYTYFATK